MSVVTLFGSRSSTSLDTCSDTGSCLEKFAECDTKPSRPLSYISGPILSAPLSRQPSAFEKVSRCLRSAITALKSMGCTQVTWASSSPTSRSPRVPKSFPLPSSDEKSFQAPSSSVRADQRSLSNASVSMRTAQEIFSDVLCPTSCMHTPAHSSNMAYQECHLFDDESLRFATSFLPTMESLVVWSMVGSAETLDPDVEHKAPSTSWIRRNTCFRPGHVIQIPSAHNKDHSYLLARESDAIAQPTVGNGLVAMEECSFPKLFLAQKSGVESQDGVDGYSRAFIMCNPSPES